MFRHYPYINFNDYNLDWIIWKVKELSENLDTFVNINTIKYAHPIEWNITRQYEANTVVIDPFDGTAYLSSKPVPSGIGISNTEYWTPIFNYISASVYANVLDYGASADGTTDDSEAFQNAVNSGKSVYVPKGEYLVHDVIVNSDCNIIGADGAVIHPLYVNDIAQNVFTFTCDNAIVNNIVFEGNPNSGYDLSVMRKSTIDAQNMDCITLENVTFKNIDNSETSIETVPIDRKGITFTAHGVKHVTLNHVSWDGNSRDEVVWITPATYGKIDDVFIDVNYCHSKNHGGWSIINAIANRINIFRFLSESSDNTNGASYMNLLCKNIVIKESAFYGRYSEIIDNRESNAFFGDSVTFEDCHFDGFTSMACALFASQIVIKRCYCHGRALIHCTNTPTTDATVISLFGSIAYSTYKPIENIVIEDCDFEADNSISGTAWISLIYSTNVGGEVHLIRSRINANNIAGSVLYLGEVTYLTVEECTFKNGSAILGSSSIIAYAELKNNVANIMYKANIADHMLAAILGTGMNKIICRENVIDSNFTGNIIDNFGTVYKCVIADTDTNQVRIYCDSFTTTNASYSEAAWSATASSAYGTELTDRLALKRGVYFVTCALPVFSSAMPVRFRNFTANQDFGGVVMGGTYGTISAVLNTNVDCEIGLITQGSTALTITNYSNSKVTAIPTKF